MSGIYIKGAKMPNNCCSCQLSSHDMCLLCGKDADDWLESRPEYCPLIELPDHGDLIDKTDLMASLADWQLSEAPEEGINWDSGRNVTSHELQYSIYRLLGDVYEEVRDEPVVIPAERSKDAQKAD